MAINEPKTLSKARCDPKFLPLDFQEIDIKSSAGQNLSMSFEKREQPDTVAVFLNVNFEEENDLFGWYDHDKAEGSSIFDEPLEEELAAASYSESYAAEIKEAYERLKVGELNYVWLLFDHAIDAEPGPLTDEQSALPGVKAYGTAWFLGNLSYSKH